MSSTMTVVALPPNIREMTTINEDQLESEFAKFAGDYAYWLWNRASAQNEVTKRKLRLDLEKAETRERYRNDPKLEKLKVDDMKAAISEDALVQAAQNDLTEAELNEARINAIVEALRAKKDMLVSLGAHQRALTIPGGP